MWPYHGSPRYPERHVMTTLYHIETSLPFDYDCTSDMVVAASSPQGALDLTFGLWGDYEDHPDLLKSLTVTKLGVVTADLPVEALNHRVICRSFHAG